VFPAYSATSVSLRSLASVVPGLTLSLTDGASVEERAEETAHGTPDEPAAERGSSEGAAVSDDPAARQSPPTPSTADQRKRLARQIEAARMGAGKK
jgi:hypothetical protein